MTSDKDGYSLNFKYQKPLKYEEVLTIQLNRIAGFRSNRNWENYEDSIITLGFMLPLELRKLIINYQCDNEINNIDTSRNGIKKYDMLWMYINKLLQEENLIFNTTYIKTYE